MPKKYIFYCIILLLLAIAGIYGYTKWTEAKEKVDLWTLVPGDAVLVVESQDHARLLKKFRQMNIWDNLVALRSVETLTENISLLDSLTNRNNGVSRFLKRKTILSSLHVVSKSDFDYVFYIPVNTVGEHRFVRSLVDNIHKSNLFSETTQDYQQFLITTITNQANSNTFSYFTYHNNLIVSANPELIKEIIRNINRGQLESPAAEYENINYLDQPEVYAHVFINYQHVPQLASLFFKDTIEKDITYLASLCRSSMLGLKEQHGQFLMNGFSYPETLAGSFYNLIKSQKPQPSEMKSYLPARTALLLHFGVPKIAAIKLINQQDKALAWPEEQLAIADSLVQTFRQELGMAYLEADKDKTSSEKIILTRSANPALTSKLLQALIKLFPAGNQLERYSNYKIYRIPVPELPLLLFGSIAAGYQVSYVTQVDNYYIFGPDAATLRSVLADIKAGRVWAETDDQKAFLAHTQQETNFSLYLNTELAWNMMNRYVQEKQRSNLLRHETLLKSFDLLAMQFSWQDGQYYTTLQITHPDTLKNNIPSSETVAVQNLATFPVSLISGPMEALHKTANNQEFWVQDSTFKLYRLAANGQRLSADSLSNALIAPIYQVVFGSDKKPKYIYATARKIYSINQSGQSVENFPFYLPDSVQAQHLTVLNLAQSNDNRLLVSDQAGNIFMFGLAGNLMPGWEPKRMEGPLAATPQHVVVGGKDVILVLQQNGYVYAYNVSGELYPGFPLALGSNIVSEAFAKTGSSVRNTSFTVITQQGEVITFGLNGRITQRRQLPRGSSVARYDLIPDQDKKSYILVRQEPGKVSLYNSDLKLLLEKNFITSSRKVVQYFDFGPLKKVYALTETGPQKTYLYNYRAKPIGRPLENKLPIALKFNQDTNSYWLYWSYQDELNRIILKAI